MADSRYIQRIRSILDGNPEFLKPLLRKLHPSDIAEILGEVTPESRKKIIGYLPVEKASEALTEMYDEENAADILNELSPGQAAELIQELNPDDAVDLLSQLPPEDIRKIISRLPKEEEQVIARLLTYEEDTAGGIMNPDVFKVPGDMTKRQALKEVIRMSEEIEDFYYVYLVDELDHLQGVISLKNLLRAPSNEKLKNLIRDEPVSVSVNADQEEAARKLSRYNLPAIPVVDEENKLVGRITFDDVMDVMEEETTEDIFKIAGVSEGEDLRGSWASAVKSRIPWLLINLVTASLAGLVISLFEGTLKSLTFMAAYMPVIAGVAGNGATQTLAVTIRRIATDGVGPKEYLSVILKEILVGVANGLLLGIVISLLALYLNQNPMLGLVVFLAMVGNLFVAGIAGSSIPILLERMKVDPAIASSILITAFTDILGFTLLLGLGTLLLL